MTADATSRSPLDYEARPDDPARLVRVGARKRTLRVVHCLDAFGVGGTELNVLRTLERLDRGRFDLSLVVLRPEGALTERFERLGIEIVPFRLPNLRGREALRQGRRLRDFLRARGADVVHCHDCYTNVFGVAAARAAGVPLVLASRRWLHALPSRAYGVANRVAYRVAHRVVANSPAVAEIVCRETRLPAARVAVIPNFVEEAAFEALDPRERERQRAALGIPTDALVVGAVAQLRPEKDLSLAVRAIARLPEQAGVPAPHLVLVGEGTCRPALEAEARALGIADRVHLVGYRPNRPNPHQLFDVSVLCSRHEGFPNSVVEAMAAGRPVVATAVGGVPDAVLDGRSGLLVPPGDADAFAGALSRLVSDAERRAAFGTAGMEIARRAYGEAVVLERLAALYETAPSRRASPRGGQ